MAVDNRAILEVEELKTFFYTSRGLVRAVDTVSFGVEQGEILGIIGESGAGKSAIALSVLRLVPYPGKIVAGVIRYKGEDLLRRPSSAMVGVRGREIAMIFQDPMSSLNPVFSIGEQIASGIRAHGAVSRSEAWARAVKMLGAVNIPDAERRVRAYQHELSGGMKQRVMISLALSCEPKLLIADNPTTALDSTIQLQFLNLILNLRQRLGMTILYITHEFGIAAKLCDRVMVLYAGEIVESGSVHAVLKEPKHPYTAGLLRSTPSLGMRGRSINAIEGRPPDPRALPNGCRFAPRCAARKPECTEAEVQLRDVGHNTSRHLVRCLL